MSPKFVSNIPTGKEREFEAFIGSIGGRTKTIVENSPYPAERIAEAQGLLEQAKRNRQENPVLSKFSFNLFFRNNIELWRLSGKIFDFDALSTEVMGVLEEITPSEDGLNSDYIETDPRDVTLFLRNYNFHGGEQIRTADLAAEYGITVAVVHSRSGKIAKMIVDRLQEKEIIAKY